MIRTGYVTRSQRPFLFDPRYRFLFMAAIASTTLLLLMPVDAAAAG